MKKRSDHLTIRQVRLIHYNRVLDAESCFPIGLSHLAANYFTRLIRRAWPVNGAQPFRGVLRVESLNAKSICCEVRAGFMVHIITDTTACLSIEYACQHHIPVIPQIVTFEDESFYEGIELDQAGFFERLRKSAQLPKTAAPPPELFREEFERLVPLGEPILCLHPSAQISGTVRSATVAAQEFPGADIRVIDTRLVAGALMCLVMKAAAWAEAGVDADRIQTRILDLIPCCCIYFLVDTLEYLARGGRIGGASALVGSLLKVKPILTLQDGEVAPYEKQRTHRRAVLRLVEIVQEQYPAFGDGCLVVMHADVPQEAAQLVEQLAAYLQLPEIPVVDLPPAISVHGGPGTLAVSFFTG